tara:strand:+ start:426 stop:905 length:480 start_codon:yes stop_codon:yes gene_type:complete
MKAILFLVVLLMSTSVLKSQLIIKLGVLEPIEKNILYNQNWFYPKYERYEANASVLSTINTKLVNCKIDIFMGTWCHDTKDNLPNFLKLFDVLNIPKENITIYNIDKTKKRPRKYIKKFSIEYLPTVIFSDDKGELGRIVEYPYETIEKDILKIFTENN